MSREDFAKADWFETSNLIKEGQFDNGQFSIITTKFLK